VSEVIDFKGKKGNIRGFTTLTPPSPLSASGTGGGCGFVVPVNIWDFLSIKNNALREKTTPTKHVVPVVPVE